MVTKPKNASKCMHISCITNAVFLLHVLVTLVAILREMHYKGRVDHDITKVCEQMRRCKNTKFYNNTRFNIHIKICNRVIEDFCECVKNVLCS